MDANVALKLTHVGLDISPELALENASRIAAQAQATNNTVRLDMEQSGYVDATLRIYRALQERYGCAGFVLQSYLHRSEADLRAMLSSAPNVRIVKGAYLEPPSLAFPQKHEVDENYVKLAELALSHDGYTAIATHDASIVARVEEFTAARGVPKRGRAKFQTLCGIASERLRAAWSSAAIASRLSVPCGSFGFPMPMRRLAGRPAGNVALLLKSVFALHGRRLRGIWAAALTPVTADFQPDAAKAISYYRELLENGCDGINVLGTTGEAMWI